MSQLPILIISDAPTSATGLGRVTRELAIQIHEKLSDVFRVGTFGFGGSHSRHLPYYNNQIHRLEGWVAPELPNVWRDFAGDDARGVLLAIWNPGWLHWLADPSTLPPSGLRTFLEDAPFEKWIYAPIDAEGIGGKIPESIREILSGFDRVLFYTDWAAKLAAKTPTDNKGLYWLPHGIDSSVFYPRDAQHARDNFVESVSGRQAAPLKGDVKIIGVVGTNTARKDWGLAFEVLGELSRRKLNFGAWMHTDRFQAHWDLVGMANEYGLASRVIFTNGALSDETMALAYSGCNCVLGIGSGEGWGLPMAEALACGTPVIHGNYGGGAEFVPKHLLIEPVGYKWDGGMYSSKRPVFKASDWADKIIWSLAKSRESLLSPEYSWDVLWPRWASWLTDGVNGG